MARVRITAEQTTGPDGRVLSRVAGHRRMLAVVVGSVAALLVGTTAVLGSTQNGQDATPEPTDPEQLYAGDDRAEQVRLGYFPNLTHAPALVGLQQGLFADHLDGSGPEAETAFHTETFNAGPAAVEALNAGAVDAVFIGPNPALHSYARSSGESLFVVSGAAAGGSQLIVREGIEDPQDLAGAVLATPQLGGTQDVAARVWLAEHGLIGDGPQDLVDITPTDNPQVLRLFEQGRIDAAWVPEPWASRLVLEAGGEMLLDERDLWADGAFPTTVLAVNQDFAEAHPQTVQDLAAATGAAVDWLEQADDAEAHRVINAQLRQDLGMELSEPVLDRALGQLDFTTDPLAQTFDQLSQDSAAAGFGEAIETHGIVVPAPVDEISEEER